MKDRLPSFLTLVFNVCISVSAIFLLIYTYRACKINDSEHIKYKNYQTYVEYIKGKSIDIDGSNKNLSDVKVIEITNSGEDSVYVDIIWESLDLSGTESSFEYEIRGESKTKESFPAEKISNVPSMTSDGILMGEKIEPGDTITYTIKINPTIDSLDDDHLYASIGLNIRK